MQQIEAVRTDPTPAIPSVPDVPFPGVSQAQLFRTDPTCAGAGRGATGPAPGDPSGIGGDPLRDVDPVQLDKEIQDVLEALSAGNPPGPPAEPQLARLRPVADLGEADPRFGSRLTSMAAARSGASERHRGPARTTQRRPSQSLQP